MGFDVKSRPESTRHLKRLELRKLSIPTTVNEPRRWMTSPPALLLTYTRRHGLRVDHPDNPPFTRASAIRNAVGACTALLEEIGRTSCNECAAVVRTVPRGDLLASAWRR